MIAYFILGFAILSLWFWPSLRSRPPLILFGLAVITGLITQRIDFLGVMWISLLMVFLTWKGNRYLRRAAVIVITAGLFMHALPGFNNYLITEEPREFFFNFDKPVFGFLFLWHFVHRGHTASDWRVVIQGFVWNYLPCAALLILLALGSHFVRFEAHVPDFALFWVFSNLIFTCVAEEAFFRGYVQAGLHRFLQKHQYSAAISVIIASIIFGLAHYRGGIAMIGLSAVAGVFYGLAFHKSKRIEASILVHFAVNVSHYFFFV